MSSGAFLVHEHGHDAEKYLKGTAVLKRILLSACGKGIRKKEDTTIWDKLRITIGIKMDFAKEWGGGYKYVDNCAEILNRFCMLGELEFTAAEEEE